MHRGSLHFHGSIVPRGDRNSLSGQKGFFELGLIGPQKYTLFGRRGRHTYKHTWKIYLLPLKGTGLRLLTPIRSESEWHPLIASLSYLKFEVGSCYSIFSAVKESEKEAGKWQRDSYPRLTCWYYIMMILSMPNRFSLNQRHEGTVNVREIEASSYQTKRAFQKGVKMVEEAHMLFDRLFFSPFPLSNRDDILIKHCVLGPSPMRFFSTSHPLAFGSAHQATRGRASCSIHHQFSNSQNTYDTVIELFGGCKFWCSGWLSYYLEACYIFSSSWKILLIICFLTQH